MRKVLLTGFEETNERLAKMLEADLEAISFPLQSFALLDFDEKALARSYDWLILTSRAAIKFYFSKIHDLPQVHKIAVVGKASQELVEQFGFTVDFCPRRNSSAKDLVNELNEVLSGRETVLFPCSVLANDDLGSLKVKSLQRFELYEPVLIGKTVLPEFDEIVFLSPSGVNAFLEKYGKAVLDDKRIYSLGDRTSAVLEANALRSEQSTISSLESLKELIVCPSNR